MHTVKIFSMVNTNSSTEQWEKKSSEYNTIGNTKVKISYNPEDMW